MSKKGAQPNICVYVFGKIKLKTFIIVKLKVFVIIL